MLLAAGPSQAYATTTSNPVQYSPTVSRLTISSSSTVSKSNESVLSPQSSTPSSNRFSFMKSISSQLNRGTELLKATVQRAIFSKATDKHADPVATAKPTPYHSDPHAVTRSSSVDSLHLEMCYIRPIRPYSLTPFRRGAFLRCPSVLRPQNENVDNKFNTLKVKPRFKLQKGRGGSAFCALGKENRQVVEKPVERVVAKGQKKVAASGRAAKRKRNQDEEVRVVEDELVPKQVRKSKPSAAAKNRKSTQDVLKPVAKAGKKRKSLEQEKQEREDFEMAKRLQKELNSSNDSMISVGTTSTRARNGRSVNSSVNTNTSYSLRTTRSLSKFSLSSLSSSMVLEEIDEEEEDAEEELPKNYKTKSSPTKNGLKSRDNGKKRTRGAIKEEEKEEKVYMVPKAKTMPNGRPTTRSRVTKSTN